jgi:WhiB family transcriptional regulator, redox-sensing transcriptional regulator
VTRTLHSAPRTDHRPTNTASGTARICLGCGDPYQRSTHERQREFDMRRYCSRPCASRNAGRAHIARSTTAVNPDPVTPRDREWRLKGACRTAEADAVFFHAERGEKARAKTAAAKVICWGCPVIDDCREWGITNEVWGVWGGLDATELATIRSERRRG